MPFMFDLSGAYAPYNSTLVTSLKKVASCDSSIDNLFFKILILQISRNRTIYLWSHFFVQLFCHSLYYLLLSFSLALFLSFFLYISLSPSDSYNVF